MNKLGNVHRVECPAHADCYCPQMTGSPLPVIKNTGYVSSHYIICSYHSNRLTIKTSRHRKGKNLQSVSHKYLYSTFTIDHVRYSTVCSGSARKSKRTQTASITKNVPYPTARTSQRTQPITITKPNHDYRQYNDVGIIVQGLFFWVRF